MSVRKFNAFLDHEDSNDDETNNQSETADVEGDFDRGYDSEAAEEQSRVAAMGRSKKRVKTSGMFSGVKSDDEDENDLGDDDKEDDDDEVDLDEARESQHEDEEDADPTPDLPPSFTHPARSTIPTDVHRANQKIRKSGVLYISRVPPFLKPSALRHFLQPYAPRAGLGRVFLTPEAAHIHTSRVRTGGNKKRSFTDGWVEFLSKKEAKRAAELLNGNVMGGKKGGYYHDDVWSLKYLRGFKWSHLDEQIRNENAERAARLREEVRRTRRENRDFMRDYERGKMLERMEGKRKGREGKEGQEEEKEKKMKRPKMTFKQKEAVDRTEREKAQDEADVKRVLGKIF